MVPNIAAGVAKSGTEGVNMHVEGEEEPHIKQDEGVSSFPNFQQQSSFGGQ